MTTSSFGWSRSARNVTDGLMIPWRLLWQEPSVRCPASPEDDAGRPRLVPVPVPRTRTGMTALEGFFLPVLAALAKSGGRARLSAIIEFIEGVLEDHFSAQDLESTPSDDRLRWQRTMGQQVKCPMVKAGLLKPDSPKGTWEISELGAARLEEETGLTVAEPRPQTSAPPLPPAPANSALRTTSQDSRPRALSWRNVW